MKNSTMKSLTKRFKSLIVIAFLTAGAFTVNAQSYVSNSVAMERLEIRLSDYYNAAEQNDAVAQNDKKIAKTFINGVAIEISTGRNIENAINVAHNKTLDAHSQDATRINEMKTELETLLSE